MSSEDSTSAIRASIRDKELSLRAKHTWLAHQNAIGLSFFWGAIAACLVIGALYLHGFLVWWFAVGAMAVAISVLHELEHDLIHTLFFKRQPWLRNTCLFTIWWLKLHVNPWWRAPQHLHHHRRSGQQDDIEERLLGIGMPWGPLRFLVALHPGVSLLVLLRLRKHVRRFSLTQTILMSAPTFLVMLVIWEVFFGYVRVRYGFAPSWDPAHALPAEGWALARNLAVLWFMPNILRQSCLALSSSYCHYYADIDDKNITEQTQVLSHWALWPLQLFCFNFAATHWLHHFVVDQPFWLRPFVAHVTSASAVTHGVRMNDVGIVARNNRRSD